MSIWIDKGTRLVVQGITGRDGSFHTRQMIEYGTNVVAGVTPGKGGQQFDGGVPVFNTVAEAVAATGANCSVRTSSGPCWGRVTEGSAPSPISRSPRTAWPRC